MLVFCQLNIHVLPLAPPPSFLPSGLAAFGLPSVSFRIPAGRYPLGTACNRALTLSVLLLCIAAVYSAPWLLAIPLLFRIFSYQAYESTRRTLSFFSPNTLVLTARCRKIVMSGLSVWLADCASELLSELFKGGGILQWWGAMCLRRKCLSKVENVEENENSVLLDLPELALDGILSRLPASDLCQMAGVCKELRKRCMSNHLWEPLWKEKWGKIAGASAFKEWQWSVAVNYDSSTVNYRNSKTWIWPLSCIWPLSWPNSQGNRKKSREEPPLDSLMAWYRVLESGHYWLPAQVYNREHGHVGFMLSCYDAELSYDRRTDTFQARYPPHGSRTIVMEEGVQWERLRAPPVDTLSHDVHVTHCLEELWPGDHVEVQWRRNKEFPYGWWYGVVGHGDMCSRDTRHCRCHLDDTVWLEFNQYTHGSRWRRAAINRKAHREEGNEAKGFYGGIRKLRTKEEIANWKRFWPNDTLE